MNEGRQTIPIEYLTCAFGSAELKRQPRRQMVSNSSIFLCLKQFQSYQNALACIQNIKKTVLDIFASNHLIQAGNFKIP